MCVRVCVYVCVCVSVYIYMCVCVCLCVQKYFFSYPCVYVSTFQGFSLRRSKWLVPLFSNNIVSIGSGPVSASYGNVDYDGASSRCGGVRSHHSRTCGEKESRLGQWNATDREIERQMKQGVCACAGWKWSSMGVNVRGHAVTRTKWR